jgi:hypothetical protein
MKAGWEIEMSDFSEHALWNNEIALRSVANFPSEDSSS